MRLVLDTNVILDLVLFDEPSTRALRGTIESGSITVYTCDECLEELRRVLDYPKFRQSADRDAAYARYAAWAQCAPLPALPAATLPRCSDPDDQKFLALAHAVGAQNLVTKDKALLELAARARKYCGFDICTPTQIGVNRGDNRDRHGA